MTSTTGARVRRTPAPWWIAALFGVPLIFGFVGSQASKGAIQDDLTERAPTLSGARHGLIGMRERILVIGGLVKAGTEGNQFVVRARVPFQGAALAAAERDQTWQFTDPSTTAPLATRPQP